MVMPDRVANHGFTAAVASMQDLLSRFPSEWVEQHQDMVERTRIIAGLLRERLADPAVTTISDAALKTMD